MNGKRILIVDGDRHALSGLTAQLVAHDYLVSTATDAVQAFHAFRSSVPDLVVLSLDLPGEGALRVHEQIRRVSDDSVPIVYLARTADPERRDQARALDAAAILDDPLSIEALLDTVERLFSEAREPDRRGSRGRALRLLVVEDDPSQRRLIEACLHAPGRETIEITFAETVATACSALAERRYGCVLLDHKLPDGSGLDVLEESEEYVLTTPVIGLSATDDATIAVDYFRAGCIDFFAKHEVLNADTLRRGIARALSRFQRRVMATLIERQQLGNAIVKSQEGLITLARTDRVTAICNRAVFDDLHPDMHNDAVERHECYTVCMADIDNFKLYNDRHGHAAGDVVLRSVAEALSSTLRNGDFIARYGGEEFVILLPDLPALNVERVVDRIRRQVHDLAIAQEGSAAGRVTVSIGAAVFDPGVPEGGRAMLQRADAALYAAKEAGRNRVCIAPPALPARAATA